tara:strand:- start:3445 stop:4566 length:1122 start_codon:yes stop_codon:yes gene_type:complete
MLSYVKKSYQLQYKDGQIWINYSDKDTVILHKALDDGIFTVDIQDTYTIDFVTMTQTNKYTGYTRNIRDGNAPIIEEHKELRWYCMGDNSTLYSYTDEVNDLINECASNETECEIEIHGVKYKVDPNQGLQININTGFCRRIVSTGVSQSTNNTEISEALFLPQEQPEDKCTICLDDFSQENPAVKLFNCKKGHYFHKVCIKKWLMKTPICPVCKIPYGEREGTMPKGSIMKVMRNPDISLPGYESAGSIEITYIVPDGIQDNEHPSPNTPYQGVQWTAWLPDTTEGAEVTLLLRRAFNQRLTFKIGTSGSTGLDNQVVWGSIHHKTRKEGGCESHGYPDPEYLTRVKEELAGFNIIPPSSMAKGDDTSAKGD